jgi:DNA-binding FrmR family transcriptional regulator
MSKCCEELPPNHVKMLPRINRVIGQCEGVKKMIEQNRYCPDILIQLHAIRSALRAIEGNILEAHLQNCVTQSFGDKKEQNKKIAEIKKLFCNFDNI